VVCPGGLGGTVCGVETSSAGQRDTIGGAERKTLSLIPSTYDLDIDATGC